MKNALLALALFAFVGSAAAHEGEKTAKKGKKAAKMECSEAQKSAMGSSCCMKKGTKTAAVTPAPAAAPAVKSL
ncbi:hypothetical protein [Hymenobacter metallilatus]|uniref:Phosphate starvation-inducible protein PsiF n=1 Tax=Hymenobacter metallilatus TaxID=2493666 RepID=A0A3R9M8R5_9BACT|nr:hypothetical protein [Hymenobacter metallilatus]RSK33123.1 hypothetical protein EI290_10425 [Hymenobacter metallilatus]